MAKTYTFTDARQRLTEVLAQAEKDGEVKITYRGGKSYIIRPVQSEESPLNVPGVKTAMTRQEILDSIREGREMSDRERREDYN
jgi:prevent-host-death family protein